MIDTYTKVILIVIVVSTGFMAFKSIGIVSNVAAVGDHFTKVAIFSHDKSYFFAKI
jgi:hypothetical protein